jgi:hypothetical protein
MTSSASAEPLLKEETNPPNDKVEYEEVYQPLPLLLALILFPPAIPFFW